MAKTRIIYELSEEQIVEIFRLWTKEADMSQKSDPSPTVNAAVFIEYARKVGA